jgi:hypothetical protein
LHAVTLSRTIIIVKTARTVWKNLLSGARRGHAPQLLAGRYLATIRIAAISEWLPRHL